MYNMQVYLNTPTAGMGSNIDDSDVAGYFEFFYSHPAQLMVLILLPTFLLRLSIFLRVLFY